MIDEVEAVKNGRSLSVSDEFPMVLSYSYARGLSPISLTLDEANELLIELKETVAKISEN